MKPNIMNRSTEHIQQAQADDHCCYEATCTILYPISGTYPGMFFETMMTGRSPYEHNESLCCPYESKGPTFDGRMSPFQILCCMISLGSNIDSRHDSLILSVWLNSDITNIIYLNITPKRGTRLYQVLLNHSFDPRFSTLLPETLCNNEEWSQEFLLQQMA